MADEVSSIPKALQVGHANPSKFFSHFLYKALVLTVFLVLLPLFPSLAPDFMNQSLHARSWELLQLIFVGIAVSYGLFSKKNDETVKDHHHQTSKIDNAQSYVSKLLQVSSVFDDESDHNHTVIEENKFQTLNSQYYRGEPALVETPVAKQDNGVVSLITQKPLLLPVRSLKQRVPSHNDLDLADHESSGKIVSRSGSKRFNNTSSRKPRNGDLGRLNVQKVEEKLEENVVLPSPIPWRSRSGRLEMKENVDDHDPSMEDHQELNRQIDSRSFRSSRPNSSFSSEPQAKVSEDVVRKTSFLSSPPPPAPPPPPPPPTQHLQRKAVLMKSNSSVANNANSSEKVLRRSTRSVPESEGVVKSVRTFRPSDLVMGAEIESMDHEKNEFIEKVMVETTDDENEDSEAEEDDYLEEMSSSNREGGNGDESVNDSGPDVDKKADEFIAKFREQIRLQRIESIRRSTAQRVGKNLR